jgi:Mg-chelatase subunit ChlD
MLLFTDGHANVSLRGNGNGERALRQQLIESEIAQMGEALKKVRVSLTLVDTQSGFVSDDDSRRVAEVLGADFIRLL